MSPGGALNLPPERVCSHCFEEHWGWWWEGVRSPHGGWLLGRGGGYYFERIRGGPGIRSSLGRGPGSMGPVGLFPPGWGGGGIFLRMQSDALWSRSQRPLACVGGLWVRLLVLVTDLPVRGAHRC